MEQRILVVNLNPTLQKTTFFPHGWTRGEVNRSSSYFFSVSGKGGNCARILAQLGNRPYYLTPLGGMYKDYFQQEMETQGVDCRWVESQKEIRYCQTLISGEPRDCTEIVEEGLALNESCEKSIVEAYLSLLEKISFLVIIGSPAPGLSTGLYKDMAKEAERRGIPYLLDLSRQDLEDFLSFSPRMIKINAKEFLWSFLGQSVEESWLDEKPINAMENQLCELSSKGCDFVITQGAGPIRWASQGKIQRFSPPEMKVLNPIGCGDAMAAGLAHGLSRGWTVPKSLELAMECSRKNGELILPGTINSSHVKALEH